MSKLKPKHQRTAGAGKPRRQASKSRPPPRAGAAAGSETGLS